MTSWPRGAWPAPHILYGGDYNPEQWPPEVWREDAALMRKAGVNLATVGVFSWARLEPSPGEFDFAWLADVLDLLDDAGVAVVLATPTASPPPWLSALHPDVLPVDASGVRYSPGSRQHFCVHHPEYRASAGELGRECQVTSGAITNRLGRLEQRGWVRRDVDLSDRRQVLVTLTEAGHARVAELIAAKSVAERRFFADLDRGALERMNADLNNNPDYGYAGAITAALFLNRFVTNTKAWLHLDIAAWTDRPKPGRPRGAEPNAARAIYAMLKARFSR